MPLGANRWNRNWRAVVSAGRLAVEGELRNQKAAAVIALLCSTARCRRHSLSAGSDGPPSGSVTKDSPTTTPPPQGSQNLEPATRELNSTASDVVAAFSPSRSMRQEAQAAISTPQLVQNIDPSARELKKTASDVAAGSRLPAPYAGDARYSFVTLSLSRDGSLRAHAGLSAGAGG